MTHRLVELSNEIYTWQTPCSIWATHRFQILCNTSRVSSLHLLSVQTYCIWHNLCVLPKSSDNCTFLLHFYAWEVLQTWTRNGAWMLSTRLADLCSLNPSLELPSMSSLSSDIEFSESLLSFNALLTFCFGGILVHFWHHVMYCITRQPYWIKPPGFITSHDVYRTFVIAYMTDVSYTSTCFMLIKKTALV